MATTVGIENKAGKLRLRLPRAVVNSGSQRYISTGLGEDSRNKVQTVAWQIEEDLKAGTLDTTLERYKQAFRPQKLEKVAEVNLLELWEGYCEYKRPQLAQTTFFKDYQRKYYNRIKSLPTHKLTEAVAIRDYLLSTISTDATKRTLTYISACCDWAVKSQLIKVNPFSGMAGDIKKPKQQNTIAPFTKAERDSILEAFRKQQPHYFPFVSFLFATGCRTGEAIGLRWANVSADYSYVIFSESLDSETGARKTTKTGVVRKFPCNQALQSLLKSLKRGEPSDLVFTDIRGEYIHNSCFIRSHWKGYKDKKGLITALVDQGRVTSYRCLYNTRHTFISHCLEAGVPVTTVATWVGNSPEILMKHYAGVASNFSVPEW